MTELKQNQYHRAKNLKTNTAT